jgi:hypothetical protein
MTTPTALDAAKKPSHTPNLRAVYVSEDSWRVVDERDQFVALVCERTHSAEVAANAHLFAASPDLLAACHGGEGAQPFAMPHNLAYYAELLQRDQVSDQMRAVMVHTLTEYSRVLSAAIQNTEVK